MGRHRDISGPSADDVLDVVDSLTDEALAFQRRVSEAFGSAELEGKRLLERMTSIREKLRGR